MVVDVKVAREARAGALRLVPRSVAPLPFAQVGKTPLDGRVLRSQARASCSASTAQAVCDGVLRPMPANDSSTYEWQLSPQPPSAFCTEISHATARSTMSSPVSSAARAEITHHVP